MLDVTETSKPVFGGTGVDRCEGGDRTPTASFSSVAAIGGDSEGPQGDGISGGRSSSVGGMHNDNDHVSAVSVSGMWDLARADTTALMA
jgi:hypothetical protein